MWGTYFFYYSPSYENSFQPKYWDDIAKRNSDIVDSIQYLPTKASNAKD